VDTAAMTTRFRLREVLDGRAEPMSQSELSRRSGVSLTTINALVLNKTTRVDLSTLDSLARELRVRPGDLIEAVEE
jgi:DNA-binding Xre family transcriptional regulator